MDEFSDPSKCGLCGGPIDKNQKDSWKQVVGWVGGPRKDSMRLREDTGRYAHDYCVEKVQAGQAPDQESMFDDPTHGRIDKDIQEAVEEMSPRNLGQRVALENTAQNKRDMIEGTDYEELEGLLNDCD